MQMRLALAEPSTPPVAARRVRNVATSGTGSNSTTFDAAAQTRRTLGWQAPTTSPNTHLLYSLTTLRDRSRAAARNDGYAAGALDRLVTNIIGHGIKPLSQVLDPEARKAIHAKWLQWTDESDADGLLEWYGQQAQATRTWLEAGEAFVRMRPRLPEDGLSVPLQIQILEPELCPHTHNTTLSSGNRVRAGIEFDRIGRRVAYWFHPSRPGSLTDYDIASLVRVPAVGVIHLYDPRRPGQLRGIPHLTPGLVRLFELDKFEDAVLLRHQLQNLFMGFLKRAPGTTGLETAHPLTNTEPDTDAEGRPMLQMEPGTFNELDPGEEVVFSAPPELQAGYTDFMRQQLLGACAATGVPYETLTGDMSKVNDRTIRVVLQEFRRRVQMWQHQIVAFQLCRRVWRAWMDRADLSGALTMPGYALDPLPWQAVKWSPHAWPYQHPVQDMQAAKGLIRAGLTSRAAVVSEQGEDVENIDAQQAADNARADALGLVHDTDPRQVSNAGLTQARPAGSVPPEPGELGEGNGDDE